MYVSSYTTMLCNYKDLMGRWNSYGRPEWKPFCPTVPSRDGERKHLQKLKCYGRKKKKDFTCSSPQKKKNKVLGIVLKWSCPFKRTWIWINTYARWLVQQRSEHTGATNSSGIKNVAVVQKEESREKQAWSITQELSCRYFSSVKIWWDLNTSQVLGN